MLDWPKLNYSYALDIPDIHSYSYSQMMHITHGHWLDTHAEATAKKGTAKHLYKFPLSTSKKLKKIHFQNIETKQNTTLLIT